MLNAPFLAISPILSYHYPMTIEQIVDIYPDHRMVLHLPPDIPPGKANVVAIITPEPAETDEERRERFRKAVEHCGGLGKRLGSKVTSDDIIRGRREDLALEQGERLPVFWIH
ncbi:MAG: hypothetical protein LBG22_02350 [Treponema sp.]|nr:hypothetical protein [Treponema sp.]